jgi:ATP-dependent Clp protease, protease subunit
MKKSWSITAKGRGAVEIRLYDEIGDSLFSEGTSAKAFTDELAAAGHLTDIHLRVNSPGGNVFDGIAIYNALLGHGATVTAQVDGLAASIASVVIMAAEHISVARTALVMIHNPRSFIGGDAGEFRKMADTLDRVRDSMVTAYRRHTKKPIEQVRALMDAETWFNPAEAKEAGFVDEIIDPDEQEDEELAAAFDPRIFARFRNVPQQIAARLQSPRPIERVDEGERERQRLRVELLRRL